jgi:hypothetical protein
VKRKPVQKESGKARLVAGLRMFLPPREPAPPVTDTADQAWTEFKIRQLEARQAWLLRVVYLVVLAVLVDHLGLETVSAVLKLLP